MRKKSRTLQRIAEFDNRNQQSTKMSRNMMKKVLDTDGSAFRIAEIAWRKG